MKRIIIIGGGWAGVAAALSAVWTGMYVTLIERTDMLLGLGNAGGIMNNNGRMTASLENKYMGAGTLFEITENHAVHKNVDFPGHSHANFCNMGAVEPDVKRLLTGLGVELRMVSRVVDVITEEKETGLNKITSLVLSDGSKIRGDVFIDCTGTVGPPGNCADNGNGCSMCIMRCPAFGPRISISAKAGGEDFCGLSSAEGQKLFGSFSGSCRLEKTSLSRDIQKTLKRKGFAVIPIPASMINREKLGKKACRQYALSEYAENVILIDTGHAKMMTPYYPLEELRRIPGFEDAVYAEPLAGGKGNSVRYMAVTRRDNTLKVKRTANLFCAGEKAGLFVGHTEAISTGHLAGHNASRLAVGQGPLTLPDETAVGKIISASGNITFDDRDLLRRFTFAGDEFFGLMKKEGLYSTDDSEVKQRIENHELLNLYVRGLL